MSRHFFTLFLVLLNINALYSQTIQWVKKGISPGFETGNAITCDGSGNVYAAGQIEYSSVFDNQTASSYGSHDILVVKYDNKGKIKWIRSAGGRGGDVAYGIGVDASQNTYVTGEVEDTAHFGSGINVISEGANDIFLAKYNSSGNIVWVKRWGSSASEKALSLAVSSTGDCFITGYFSSSINFNGTQINSTGGRDIFLAKINSNGNLQWVKGEGGNGDDRAYSVALDLRGNIYLAGSFTQSASFDGITVTNSGKNSAFVAKYNSNGNVQWVKKAGDCCDTTQYRSVSVDENGNVYTAGYFNVTTKIGSYQFNSLGSSDIVVAKYSSTGNLLWAKQAGGIAEDIAYGINVDLINHIVYVTGSVADDGSFDSFNYTMSGFKDVFVVAYNPDGNVLWDKISGGSRRDIGSSITTDKLGYIYTTGIFNGTAYFDTETITGYPDQPWADFYIDKISALPATIPSTPASNLSITHGTCTDLNISFLPGNGEARIVVMHQNSSVSASPANGSIYNANPVFGNGSDLGNGNYIVYNGTGNNVTVSGLAPGLTYFFSVIEYNGTGASNSYGNAVLDSATTRSFAINITGLQSSICIGDSMILHAVGASTYSWSPSIGLSSTLGSTVVTKPQSTTNYTVNAVDSAGCLIQISFTINVNPLPMLHFPNLNDVCANDSAILLNTGTPNGGFYSGPGINNDQFNPLITGPGIFELLYTYTDTNGCTNFNSASVTVKSIPAVSLSSKSNVCFEDEPVILQGNPSGGVYTGTGVTSGFFDPSVGAGIYLISYQYLGSNGCSNIFTVPIIVNALPIINIGEDKTVCGSDEVLIDAGTGFTSYSWSDGSTLNSVNVDSNGTGFGVKAVHVKVGNSSGCFNMDTVNISFDICNGIAYPGIIAYANIFPNPFVNEFNFNRENIYSYHIFDLCGRLLEKGEQLAGQISAGNNLLPGVYLFAVDDDKGREIFVIVKSQ